MFFWFLFCNFFLLTFFYYFFFSIFLLCLVPPPLEFHGRYGELKFVNDGESIEKSPDSVQPTPGLDSMAQATTSSGGKSGSSKFGGASSKTGSTWTVGQGSPQAPASTAPSVLPSPERGVAVFS